MSYESAKFSLRPHWFLRCILPFWFKTVEVEISTDFLSARKWSVNINHIKGVRLTPRKFWTRIEIINQQLSDPVFIGRFAKSDATEFYQSVKFTKFGDYMTRLSGKIENFVEQSKYLSQSEVRDFSIFSGVNNFKHFDIGPNTPTPEVLRNSLNQILLFKNRTKMIIEEHNNTFVSKQKTIHKRFFNSVEANPLTDKQTEAAIRNEDNNLIVAGAGTGKTACVVSRIGYLLEEGLAQPDQILVLAYGKKTQEELEERVLLRLGRDDVMVKTFHSLGMLICAGSDGIMPSVSRLAEDDWEMERFIDSSIARGISNPTTRQYFIDFLAYYRHEIIDEWSFEFLSDYYSKLALVDLRALDGTKVKSQEELRIANWFILNSIEYEYEAEYPFEQGDRNHRSYKPDFYFPEYDLWLEHFGINEHGETAPHIDNHKYHEQMDWKRKAHKRNGTDLIETFSYQHRRGIWENILKELLTEYGIKFQPVSESFVLKLLREKGELSNLAKFLKSYIELLKTTDVSIEQLKVRGISGNEYDNIRSCAFLKVLTYVYVEYERELDGSNEIDFGDMIRLATQHVQNKSYVSNYTHIIVDEFQDISCARANLIRALLSANKYVRFFCVGDDWQSIFRFAGSDVKIMSQFNNNFGSYSRTDLNTTFRYPKKLLSAASRFVTANPVQLRKNISSTSSSLKKPIKVCLYGVVGDSTEEPESLYDVLSQIYAEIRRHKCRYLISVLLLGRYNFIRDDIPDVFLENANGIDPEFQTIHKAKGREADFVILLGANRGKYGFPTAMADDPLFQLVLGDEDGFPNAEERRLFYVALTRAKQMVYIVGAESFRSEFIDELLGEEYRAEVEHPPQIFDSAICPECGGRLIHRSGRYGLFWSCEYFPKCEGRLTVCKACKVGAVQMLDGYGQCNYLKCRKQFDTCPRCSIGLLVDKTGRFGPFMGCSKYPHCKFSRNITGQYLNK